MCRYIPFGLLYIVKRETECPKIDEETVVNVEANCRKRFQICASENDQHF